MKAPLAASELKEQGRKLLRLEARYAKHQAKFPTAWLDYGETDPVGEALALLSPCRTCGRTPRMLEAVDECTVRCPGCGAKAEPARHAWRAGLNWNQSVAAAPMQWPSFPFFFLGGLSFQDAESKLDQLHLHLFLRTELEGLRRELRHAIDLRLENLSELDEASQRKRAQQATGLPANSHALQHLLTHRVGRSYYQRLRAYLMWCRFAQRLMAAERASLPEVA